MQGAESWGSFGGNMYFHIYNCELNQQLRRLIQFPPPVDMKLRIHTDFSCYLTTDVQCEG
jgi:hypothetical protein